MSTTDITPASIPQRRGVFTPELLDRCISFGFCLPACPTYALTGVETSSPRGRVNLMRALETGVLADDDPTVREEASFCLGCRACEPVCPAGVQYGALLEEWRDHLWNGRRRPLKVRPLLWAVDSPRRVRAMGIVRRHAGRGGEAPGPEISCSGASSGSCIRASAATRESWSPSSRRRPPKDAAAPCTRTTERSSAAMSWRRNCATRSPGRS